MFFAAAVIMLVVLVCAALGIPAARRFVYGYFHGANLYVLLTVKGRTVVYKNPPEHFGFEDHPMGVPPADLFDSARYETYYNVCWFDTGTLYRCQHAFHRTPEEAGQCSRNNVPGSMIGTIVEER